MTARQRLLGADSAALKERIAFVVLLVATALVNTVNLAQNGWANAFYTAAAQAGSSDGEAFLFGSSDAANSITVDKPPMSLWFMDLSVRLFGLSPLSILLPEALMGVATVAVLYLTVRRAFSWQTALLAGGVLALTPVVALMFRYNNPDALLTLLMSLALYFTLRGIESGRLRWLLLAGAMVGFGFLTKQLQAFLILPALAGIYLVAAPGTWWRRIWQLLAALGAVIVSAGWWVAIVTLTPPNARPYVGGSQTNSFLELTFGYNGLGRIDGSETGSVTNGSGSPWGNPGIARLFQGDIGGQIAWLIPGTMLLTVVAFLLIRGNRSEPRRTVLMLLTADFLVTGLTFSFAAGIFHQYYTVALGPPLAGMFAIGASMVWTSRAERWVRLIAAGAIVATLIWTYALLGEAADFLPGLPWLVVAVSVVAIVLVVVLPENRIGRACTIFAALLACLLGPTVWTLETVVTQHTGAIPTAGPLTVDTTSSQVGGNQAGIRSLLGAPDVTNAERRLLLDNASRYTWVAAAVGSNTAAGYQLATLKPVMPVGGFNGSDPSPTLRQFKADVAAGRIHYFIGGLLGPSNGGSSAAEAIDKWVRSHYRAIRLGGVSFYDLSR